METQFKEIKEFIENIQKEKIILSNEKINTPFKIILSSSDYYYRENFHSDIICSILKENKIFLQNFIVFIKSINDNIRISINDYLDYNVEREQQKIDILIYSNKTKHCIIIENKINDAVDMNRQLPRYVELKRKDNFIVDAIIYLSLNGQKSPDESTWLIEDKSIKNLIINIATASHNQKSLSTDFLQNCLKEQSCKIQEFTFINQYIDLLEFLRRNELNNEIMEKFYSEIKTKENFKTAKDIMQMMNDMPEYRIQNYRLRYIYDKEPFDKIGIWKDHQGLIFENCTKLTNYNLKFEIYTKQESTLLIFKVQNEDVEENYIKSLLEKMQLQNDFTLGDKNNYHKEFIFPDEEEKCVKYIGEFKSKLETLVNVNTKI